MPVQLIGKKVNFTGKSLWEILGNLKNFGVGRLVIKSHFKTYPEPSYYKIVKVQPVMAPKEKYYDRRVMVWAEHVFRGNKYPSLVKMHDRTFKPKFQLIPRSEEEVYLKDEMKQEPNEIPTLYDCPPLMQIYMKKKLVKQGINDLKPIKTVITGAMNERAFVGDKQSLLKARPPRLYADYSVEQLTKKLEELKAIAETTVTAEAKS